MRLWTFHPYEVYQKILDTGEYHCEPYLGYNTTMEFMEFENAYLWLAQQMREKIGNPPDGIKFPVWAWHTQNWKHKKPDLRYERFHYGNKGEKWACIEIEVPDNQVLLSDFDLWHCVLNDWNVDLTEEEYNNAPQTEEYRHKTWQRIFDLTPIDNDWITRGMYIQATFWQLTKDMIKDCRVFISAFKHDD